MNDIKISVKNNDGEITAAGNDVNINREARTAKHNTENERDDNSIRRILLLSANPGVTPQLALDKEVRDIEEGFLRSKYRDRFEIRSRLAVRLRDVRRALLDTEPHIVHFTGHGEKNGLWIEDDSGLPVLLSAGALTGLFELYADQVECVILSACHSASQATAINKYIRYVVGMKKEIRDKAAIEFAVGFYDAMAAGKTIETAFKFGSNAIRQIYPKLPDHLIPILKIGGAS